MAGPKRRLGRGLEALLATPEGLGTAVVQLPEDTNSSRQLQDTELDIKTPYGDPIQRVSPEWSDRPGEPFSSSENLHTDDEDRQAGVQPTGVHQDAIGDSGVLRYLPVEYLERSPFQPRRDMNPETLEELAQSIRSQGIMQPIIVRQRTSTRYEIIAGERRWRASQIIGLDRIPCLVRDVPDEAAMAMALIENLQREDLNPIEEAVALQKLQAEFDMTHADIAQMVGRSRAAVSNSLRLLHLAPITRKMLEHGDLEMGHARALLSLKGDVQIETAKIVVAKSLSVRQTEALVKRMSANIGQLKKEVSKIDPNISALENGLSERLGASVKIIHSKNGRGRLIIQYHSLPELDGIIELIKPS